MRVTLRGAPDEASGAPSGPRRSWIPYVVRASAAVAALNALAAHLDCDFDPEQTESTHIIGHWNDYPGRKLAEIVTALTEAAGEWDRLHHQGGENR